MKDIVSVFCENYQFCLTQLLMVLITIQQVVDTWSTTHFLLLFRGGTIFIPSLAPGCFPSSACAVANQCITSILWYSHVLLVSLHIIQSLLGRCPFCSNCAILVLPTILDARTAAKKTAGLKPLQNVPWGRRKLRRICEGSSIPRTLPLRCPESLKTTKCSAFSLNIPRTSSWLVKSRTGHSLPDGFPCLFYLFHLSTLAIFYCFYIPLYFPCAILLNIVSRTYLIFALVMQYRCIKKKKKEKKCIIFFS